MKRNHIVGLLFGLAAVALVLWIMRNTYWDEVTIPTAIRGEAALYPLYAAESLAKKLGAHTSRDSEFQAPATNAIVYLRDWTWDLGNTRRSQLERWVEAGGRLVIDESVYRQRAEFTFWSGIEFFVPEVSKEERKRRAEDEVGNCEEWRQTGIAPIAGNPVDRTYMVCDHDTSTRVRSLHLVSWALHDRDGMQALRVEVGKGSVTAITGLPLTGRDILSGEHAELFVALAQLRGGDRIHFLSEDNHPSLLVLAWRRGAPAILLASLALLLTLWRGGTRFGPLMPADQPLRRSLVEQIRGTGQFALRYGGGSALHAAMVRATRNAAARRLPGFGGMTPAEQSAAMAQAGWVTTDAMAAALQTGPAQRSRSLLSSLALLETVRRRILSGNPRKPHGN